MERKPGFYWVKPPRGSWEIDEWCSGWVSCLDACIDSGDHMYEQIDERRIERPEEAE